MKRFLRGDVTLLAALLVALIVIAVRLARPPAATPTESKPHYTIASTAPSGLDAFAELLRARGYRTGVLSQRPSAWPDTASVVVTAPPYEVFGTQAGWTDSDAAQVVKWVRAGGHLLVFCQESDALAKALELAPSTDGGVGAGRLVQPIPSLARVRAVQPGAPARFDEPSADRLPIARAGEDPIAIAWTEGKGLIVAVAPTSLATNAYLGKADNARFVAGLVDWLAAKRTGPVLFDEWHQGNQSESSFWKLIGNPGQSATWQLVGVGLLWAASASRRFGRPRGAGLRSRTTGDFVGAVAELYRTAGATEATQHQLRLSLLAELAQRGGMPSDADPRRLVDAACRAAGIPDRAGALHALVERLETLPTGSRRDRERELLETVGSIEGFRRELGLRE